MARKKKITRQTYVLKMKDDMKAVMEGLVSKQKLVNQTFTTLKRMEEPVFPDTEDGKKESESFKEMADKVTELTKEFKSYCTADAYRETLNESMTQLKEATDESEWEQVYENWKPKLNTIEQKAEESYQNLMKELQALMRYLRELKRKEINAMTTESGREIPLEMYVENADIIKRAIYEKCSRGEITLEQREMALAKLNDYKEATVGVDQKILNALEDFAEGVINSEELDNLLEGYTTENPDLVNYMLGSDISERTQVLKDCLNLIYNEGTIDKATGKAIMEQINEVDDMEHGARMASFMGESYLEAVGGESTVDTDELMQGFIAVADHVAEMKESGEISVDEANLEVLRMIQEYVQEYCAHHTFNFNDDDGVVTEGSGETFVSGVLIGSSAVILGSIIAGGIGAIKQKKAIPKVRKYYEETNQLKVRFSDLTFKKKNLVDIANEYLPDLKSLMANDSSVTGKGWMITQGNNPFAALAVILGTVSGVARVYFKLLNKDASVSKHKEYYRTMIILEKHPYMDSDSMDFFKKLYKELKQKEKDQKKMEQDELKSAAQAKYDELAAKKAAKKAAKSKSSGKVTKEYAEGEDEDQNLYEEVERRIYEKCENGEITLEQREELIIEARNRFFQG